jgi:ACS family glucarate transporter-like MFS transporter
VTATEVSNPDFGGAEATRVRYWVIVFAVALAVITFIDRVCMSFAAPFVSKDLGLNSVQMGYAFSAFAGAYALFEIPGGYLGDWLGPRRVLLRIVIWWSAFTALTGAVWNVGSLVTMQALFGAGEAGCFPNLTKTFMVWLPRRERVRAQGTMWLAARWGGAFTPLVVYHVLRMVHFHWRPVFVLFGGVGIFWAAWFYSWYREDPGQNPNVNAAELALLRENQEMARGHRNIPWPKLLRSPQIWLLCLQYFCCSYGWYFYITWLPTYLRNARHLELEKSAILGMLPLFLGGIGAFVSGVVSSHANRWTGSTAKTRRLIAYVGFAGASAMLLLVTRLENPLLAMVAMGIASFCNDLVMPQSWGACMDIGREYAGTVSGTMNMFGNLGGAVSPLMTGYLLRWTHSNWNVTLYTSAGVYALAILWWSLLDPVTPLKREEEEPPTAVA